MAFDSSVMAMASKPPYPLVRLQVSNTRIGEIYEARAYMMVVTHQHIRKWSVAERATTFYDALKVCECECKFLKLGGGCFVNRTKVAVKI